MLTVIGGALLVTAAIVLTTNSLGQSSSETVGSDGRAISESHATQSVLQSSPRDALIWIGVALGVACLFGLLIRFGRTAGSLVVIVVSMLALLASMLSIGIFLAPSLGCFMAAAAVAMADQSDARARARYQVPPNTPPPLL